MQTRKILFFLGAIFGVAGLIYIIGPMFLQPAAPHIPQKPAVDPQTVILFHSSEDGIAGYLPAAKLGAELAIEDLNQSEGVLKTPLKLASISWPYNGQPPAKTIFAMFTGGESMALEAAAWAEANRVPLLLLNDGPCITITKNSGGKPSPLIWSMGLSWQSTIESFYVYLSDKFSPTEKVFTFEYIAGDTADDHMMIKAAKSAGEALGFKTLKTEFFDVRLGDYFQVVREVIADSPHILFIANRARSGRILLEQIAKLSLKREMKIAALSSFDTELFDGQLSLLDGAHTIGKYVPSNDSEQNKQYRERMQKAGAKPEILEGSVATAAFNAVHLAAKAFRKAGKNEVEAFAAAMNELEFTGPSGSIRMNGVNHVAEQTMYVLERENNSWKVVDDLGTAVHPDLDECGPVPDTE